jgi:hypothetical protein
MKKSLLFLCLSLCFAALFTGCLEPGDSDDLFSPPSWIRGTWGDSTAHHVYTFTLHDVAMTSAYYMTAGFSTLYEENDVVETMTDSLYEFTVSEDSVFLVSYHFQKLTATTLNFTWVNSVGPGGPIELVKE